MWHKVSKQVLWDFWKSQIFLYISYVWWKKCMPVCVHEWTTLTICLHNIDPSGLEFWQEIPALFDDVALSHKFTPSQLPPSPILLIHTHFPSLSYLVLHAPLNSVLGSSVNYVEPECFHQYPTCHSLLICQWLYFCNAGKKWLTPAISCHVALVLCPLIDALICLHLFN